MKAFAYMRVGTFRQLARDPFARNDLVHREVAARQDGCDWCGQLNRRGRLFEYGNWWDGWRIDWFRGTFCSVGCMRSYHNID
jgi:hypothetical protein